MDEIERFQHEVEERLRQNGRNEDLRSKSAEWLVAADAAKYEYNFSWMGRPVIQFPQDLLALQELIWRTRPELIIETGVAHGGCTVFYASMLQLLGGDRRVVGIDIDLRAHNRAVLESHPMFHLITLLEGSSTDARIVSQVRALAEGRPNVLVCLDSNHTHQHVLSELELYSPLVRAGGYVVVFDTSIEQLAPPGGYSHRPWGRGNSPRSAVDEFLRRNDRFVVDESLENKLLVTSAPGGFLRCLKS